MREQPAQTLKAIVGPTELFVAAWCKPEQHDEHTRGYRFHLYMQSAKRAAAAVREESLLIIAERNARNETLYAQAAE